MRRARGAHDVVDARRVEAALGEHAHARRRAAGASSCGPARAARALARACRASPPSAAGAARRLVRFAHDPRPRSRRPLDASRIVPPTSPSSGWSLIVRRHRPHLRRGRGRARPARASGEGDVVAARAAARARIPPRVLRRRQARRDHRRRERPAVARRSARPCSTSPARRARARRPTSSTRRRRRRHGAADELRVRRRTRRRRSPPTIPNGRSRSSSRRAPPGCPKGALYCNRQLAFITQTDVGDAWDGGGRSFSGTSFAHLGFMTKLPGSLRRGGTTFIMERWRARRRARAARAREDDDGRRRADATRADAAPPRLRLLRPLERAASSSRAAVRSRPASPKKRAVASARALATRYSCTEAGIGLGTAFDDPEEDAIVSVGRPHAERRARRCATPTSDPSRPARSARCACAPPR